MNGEFSTEERLFEALSQLASQATLIRKLVIKNDLHLDESAKVTISGCYMALGWELDFFYKELKKQAGEDYVESIEKVLELRKFRDQLPERQRPIYLKESDVNQKGAKA